MEKNASYFIEKPNTDPLLKKVEEALNANSIDNSLILLNYIEKILDQNSSMGTIDLWNIIWTTHNLSFCYFEYSLIRLQRYYQSISYLEACIDSLNSKKKFSDFKYNLNFEIFIIQNELNLCAMLSHINKHEAALKHANYAYNHVIRIIETVCESIVNEVFYSTCEVFEGFSSVLSFLKFSKENFEFRSSLVMTQLDFVAIKNNLQMNFLLLSDIKDLTKIEYSISLTLFANILLLLLCSMYCISTENQRLSLYSKQKLYRSKYWIRKAESLSKILIPKSLVHKDIESKCNSLLSQDPLKVQQIIPQAKVCDSNRKKQSFIRSKNVIRKTEKNWKKMKKMQKNSKILKTEPDSYFEKTIGIMLTSSDLYGESEDSKSANIFDSFGNKIYI